MTSGFDTSRTLALLVGIEIYSKHQGTTWNLNGPAQDACTLAHWLVARGVPPKRIHFLGKPQNVGSLNLPEDVTVEPLTFGEVDRSSIARVLERLESERDVDVFILFWSGHGIVDEKDHRHLFLSDDRDESRSTVNLDSLTGHLRREIFRFPHQIIIVDACAERYDSFRWKEDLSGGNFNQGSVGDTAQFTLYACSPGQSAINDERHGTGLFFSALLPKLQTSDTWPPDVRTIGEELHADFVRKRDRGHADQVPDWFFHPRSILVPSRGGLNPRISVGRIPRPADTQLFEGRSSLLKELKQCWLKGKETIFGLVAPGGLGKSTVIWHFMQWLGGNDPTDPRTAFDGCSQVMEWSFYSQGQHDFQTDSGKFFSELVAHLRSCDPELNKNFSESLTKPKTDAERAIAAADSFVRIGGVIVLDGVEPLQYLPDPPDEGYLRDKGLALFLQRLAETATRGPQDPKRLLLITTRWSVGELRDRGSEILLRDVTPLDPEDGARLLAKFRLRSQLDQGLQFDGAPIDLADPHSRAWAGLKEISRILGGHPLTLMLVASILIKYHQSQVENFPQISEVLNVPLGQGPQKAAVGQNPLYRYARRVIRSYSKALESDVTPLAKASRELLFQLGLFDRPAELDWLRVIGASPPIPQLSTALQEIGLDDAICHLRDLRLVADAVEGDTIIDAHPLIREYFGKQAAKDFPEGCREAHRRLFEYFGDTTLPQTLEEMHPWFQKIVHGCKAGLHRQAFAVFVKSILREEEDFAAQQLGAYGALLSVLSHFFKPGGEWEPVSPSPGVEGLELREQFTLLKQAGTYLTPTKGYAARETAQCYQRGVRLAREYRQPRVEFEFGFGQWRVTFTHGMLEDACREAETLQNVADNLGNDSNDGFRMVAFRAQTVSRTFFGDFNGAVESATRCAWPANWNLNKARSSARQFLNEPYVTSLACSTIAKWHLGRYDTIREEGHSALALADQINHPHTTAVGLYFCVYSVLLLEDFSTCRSHLDRLLEVTSEHRFLFWKIAAQALAGLLDAREGVNRGASWDHIRKCLDRTEQRAHDWQSTGAQIHAQFWLAQKADILVGFGKLDEAADLLAEADRSVSRRKELWWAPEIRRLRGVILAHKARLPTATASQAKEAAFGARERFREAVALAETVGSVPLRLRAEADIKALDQAFGS